MMPIWPCWVREMSKARSLMESLLVLSLMILAIWTAWAWWTIISRAKPASAESLPGGWEANSSASATPAADKDTTASSTSGVFCREDGERSLRDAPPRPFSHAASSGASSLRKLLNALAVLLLTAPRGTPVRKEDARARRGNLRSYRRMKDVSPSDMSLLFTRPYLPE